MRVNKLMCFTLALLLIPAAVFKELVIAELNEAAFGLLNKAETASVVKPDRALELIALTVAAGIYVHADDEIEPILSAVTSAISLVLIPATTEPNSVRALELA